MSWTMVGKANPLTCSLGYVVGIGSPSPATVADEINGWWVISGGICAAASFYSAYTFLGTVVRQNVGGVIMEAASTDAPVTGTGTGANFPPVNCSLLVSKKTGLVGRKHRGRMYWPNAYITEGGIDNMGIIDPTAKAAIQTHFTTSFDRAFASLVAQPAVLHSSVLAADIITSFVFQDQVATQRRRMR